MVATYPTVLELAGVEEIILPNMWVKFKDFVAGIRFAFVICSWICVMFFTTCSVLCLFILSFMD